MKEKKLLDSLNGIEDEFIIEAKPEIKKRGNLINFKWIIAAACFTVLVCVAIPLIKISPSQFALKEETTSYLKENTTVKGEDIEITEKNLTEIAFETEVATETENQTETSVIEGVCLPLEKDYWKKLNVNQQYSYIRVRLRNDIHTGHPDLRRCRHRKVRQTVCASRLPCHNPAREGSA